MKRALALLVAAVATIVPLVAGAQSDETVRDEFTSGGYGGSNGTMSWLGSWSEVGEATDPGSGAVQVVASGNCRAGSCLRIGGSLVALVDRGATRALDASGADAATLSFQIRRVLGLLAGGDLIVAMSANGGATWSTVAIYPLDTSDPGTVSAAFDVSQWIAANTQVRFAVTGLNVASDVYVDDVELSLSYPPASTTTTVASTTTSSPATTTTTAPPPTSTSSTVPSTTSPVASTPSDPATTSTTTGTITTTSVTTTTQAGVIAPEQADLPPSAAPDSTTTTVGSSQGSEPLTEPGPGETRPERAAGAEAPGTPGLVPPNPPDGLRVLARPGRLVVDFVIASEELRAQFLWVMALGAVVAFAAVGRLQRRDHAGAPTPLDEAPGGWG